MKKNVLTLTNKLPQPYYAFDPIHLHTDYWKRGISMDYNTPMPQESSPSSLWQLLVQEIAALALFFLSDGGPMVVNAKLKTQDICLIWSTHSLLRSRQS